MGAKPTPARLRRAQTPREGHSAWRKQPRNTQPAAGIADIAGPHSGTRAAKPWLIGLSSMLDRLRAVLVCVKDQAGKPIAQKQLFAVRFRLGQKRQENVPHLSRNTVLHQGFEGLR